MRVSYVQCGACRRSSGQTGAKCLTLRRRKRVPLPEHLNPFRNPDDDSEDDSDWESGDEDAPRPRPTVAGALAQGGDARAKDGLAPAKRDAFGRDKLDMDAEEDLVHDFYDSDEDAAVSAALHVKNSVTLNGGPLCMSAPWPRLTRASLWREQPSQDFLHETEDCRNDAHQECVDEGWKGSARLHVDTQIHGRRWWV